MSDNTKAVRPKTKRQVPTMALGVLMVVGMGLGFGLWSSAQSERTQVVVAATDLERGDVISRDDLRIGSVGLDQGIVAMTDTDIDSVIGQVATRPISSGALFSPAMFGDAQGIPSGFEAVGATLDTGRYPSSGLSVGQSVSLIWTLDESSLRIGNAEIFEVTLLVNDLKGDLFVTFLIPEGEIAVKVAGAAAAGDLSVTAIDTDTQSPETVIEDE